MSDGDWTEIIIPVRGGTILAAARPGLPAHGRIDPAALLFAGHARIEPDELVLGLNCGNGVAGAAAAKAGAGRIVLTDRNIVAVEATRRTLALNGSDARAEVIACHGAYAVPADVVADVVFIRIPKDRDSLLQLIADAFVRLRIGGRCYLAGANAEGAKTAAKILAEVFGDANSIAHGGGSRVVLATRKSESPHAGLDGEFDAAALAGDAYHVVQAELRGFDVTLHARPGVFSRAHVDEATALLANAMRIEDGEHVLDLGCGSGALGIVAAKLTPAGSVTMVDADVEAVRSAARALTGRTGTAPPARSAPG